MVKMIVAILKDEDALSVTEALSSSGYWISRIASTGGFLRQGRSTLMFGVEESQVDHAIQIIHDNCAPTVEPISKRANIFVLKVDHYEQLVHETQ